MKIKNLRKEQVGDRVRVVASLIWEQRKRPDQEIYFETTKEFAKIISCNSNSFLIPGAITAMYYGESLITIDEEICPLVREGLITNMNWLSHWNDVECQPIPIEARNQSIPNKIQLEHRVGSFFSGGIDALATLRTNRIEFPLEDPMSIKDGIIIHGLLGHEQEGDELKLPFQHLINSLQKIAHETKITLIPIYTNVYSHLKDLDPNYHFWGNYFAGAALAAVAHTLSPRLTEVKVASTLDIPNMQNLASHPILDQNYSSFNLRIKHDGVTLSRLAKTELLTDWGTSLNNLRVCNKSQSDQAHDLNCSRCEKCFRTMLALIALDIQNQCEAFDFSNLTEESLVSTARVHDYTLSSYQELLVPLQNQGREDLVRGIKRIIVRYQEKDLKGIIKRIDRKLLNRMIEKKLSTAG